jgi:hypothetical protein
LLLELIVLLVVVALVLELVATLVELVLVLLLSLELVLLILIPLNLLSTHQVLHLVPANVREGSLDLLKSDRWV